MKKSKSHMRMLAGWACAFFFLNACQSDLETVQEKQQVSFGFSIRELSNGGRVSGELQPPAAVVVSVVDANHQQVYFYQKLELFSFEGKFISEPISLLPGQYFLSQFLVMDENEDVIYISPVEGSEKAYLVSDPLDIDFEVMKDEVTELTPEVLSIQNCDPEDFGYTSFSFEKVETFDFLIAVFAYDNATKKLKLTDAMLTITDEDHNLNLERELSPHTTRVTLPEKYEKYVISVEKAGYEKYEQIFEASELKYHLRHEDLGPLMITLKKEPLVFWNKLGSDYEISHSEVGPNLYFFKGKNGLHVPANHEYVPGIVGNAITIAPGNYNTYDRVHNLVLDDLPHIINPERGAIECYFFQKESPIAFVHNPHRIFDGPYGFVSGMGFMSHDYDEDGTKNTLTFYLTLGGQSVSVSSDHFDQFNGTWVHVAAAWDRGGVGTTNETMQLYINGTKVASTTDTRWGTQVGAKADIAGGNDQSIARQFYVDELKIYSEAKTSF